MLPFASYIITLVDFMGPFFLLFALFIVAVILKMTFCYKKSSSSSIEKSKDLEKGQEQKPTPNPHVPTPFVPKPTLTEQELNTVIRSVEESVPKELKELGKMVFLKSISTYPEFQEECDRSINQVKKFVSASGFDVEVKKNEKLASILLASLGDDPSKKTVLFYGHVDIGGSPGEGREPLDVMVKHGKLVGRGVADGKGPLYAAIQGINAYAENNINLPVNIKFCIDASLKIGSPGLTEHFVNQNKAFFSNIDMACLMEGKGEQPAVGLGSMGSMNFELKVQCGQQDLHSGIYGGAVSEAMTDLSYLLAKLSDYTLGMSIHGIRGAFNGHGDKTVIPYKVIGMFSVSTVPLQAEARVVAQLKEKVQELMQKRRSINGIELSCTSVIHPTKFNPAGPCLQAATRASKRVYGKSPNLIRLIDTVPFAPLITEIVNGNVVAMPLKEEDGHVEESIEMGALIKGAQIVASFLYEMTVV